MRGGSSGSFSLGELRRSKLEDLPRLLDRPRLQLQRLRVEVVELLGHLHAGMVRVLLNSIDSESRPECCNHRMANPAHTSQLFSVAESERFSESRGLTRLDELLAERTLL